MSGIKGLSKGDRLTAEERAEKAIKPEVKDEKALEFIKGVNKRIKPGVGKARERKYERCMFSLTKSVSVDIDKISYMPKDFRVNRSEVVKAAIDLLKNQSKEEIIKQLMKVK